jgi:PPOX class probable F420-dependent enzyme
VLGVNLDEKAVAFLEKNHSAAMTTLRRDGSPHSVRIGVALVDGRLLSSGTHIRVRTKHLRRDPRCSLFVFDPAYSYLVLDTTVTIVEGEAALEASVDLFRVMQGRPDGPLQWFGGELDVGAFRKALVDEQRLIYDFDVVRTSGLY